jgi:hypothetical protein
MQRKSTVMSTEVQGEFVVMDIQKGSYFALNQTGSEIWRALENPVSRTDLVERLCRQFDVEPSVCESRVKPFLDRLLNFGIIEEPASSSGS